MSTASRRVLKEEEWACVDAKCSNVNTTKVRHCSRCGKPKPKAKGQIGHLIGKDAAEKSKGLFSAEDWACRKCGNINWARRSTCNICNAPKHGETEARTVNPGDHLVLIGCASSPTTFSASLSLVNRTQVPISYRLKSDKEQGLSAKNAKGRLMGGQKSTVTLTVDAAQILDNEMEIYIIAKSEGEEEEDKLTIKGTIVTVHGNDNIQEEQDEETLVSSPPLMSYESLEFIPKQDLNNGAKCDMMSEREEDWMIRESINEVLVEMARMVRQERNVPMIYCPLEMMTDVSGVIDVVVERVKEKMKNNQSQGDTSTSTSSETSITISYGGGYMDRQEVEYIDRQDSDDEFDEFGRRKKRQKSTDQVGSSAGEGVEEESNEEEDDKSSDGELDDEEEDDDGDLSKYELTEERDENEKENEEKERNYDIEEEEEDEDDDDDLSKYNLDDFAVSGDKNADESPKTKSKSPDVERRSRSKSRQSESSDCSCTCSGGRCSCSPISSGSRSPGRRRKRSNSREQKDSPKRHRRSRSRSTSPSRLGRHRR